MLTSAQGPKCTDSLNEHVYNPDRLTVLKPCVAVTGTIVDATNGKRKDGVRKEADGDTHGWLKPDKKFISLLNDGNVAKEGGNLVFEIICRFPVTQEDAKTACQGFTNNIKIPTVGSHVSMIGRLVQEENHDKWIEIHPVTSIGLVRPATKHRRVRKPRTRT